MSSNATRWASAVLQRFAELGLRTDDKIVAAGGPSTTSLTALRKAAAGDGNMGTPREPTWTKVDRAAQWRAGEAYRLWHQPDHEPVGGDADDSGYVPAPGERAPDSAPDSEVLAAIREMRDELRAVRERMDRLDGGS